MPLVEGQKRAHVHICQSIAIRTHERLPSEEILLGPLDAPTGQRLSPVYVTVTRQSISSWAPWNSTP